ncbi:hypothetical protein [Acetobacter cibinongensis]|uniref:Calpain catalytic domain-containing protein n=1 Tax=Acetobacter cibinongensis TaxID=146475 RepID=A0A1Z5YR81_9PROT|nr:hypothetical protein [Acetobacter cibinongensis]OUI98367.1 hypothetical protein HK14_15545 [Acetobacter cibinongensis]
MRKLGCKPAETRNNQPYLSGLRMMARKAPARLVRDHIDPAPLMLANDQIGDCTSVGIANHLRATASLAGYQIDVSTGNAVRFYSESTGYTPVNAESDQGGVEVDVLGIAGRDGYHLDHGTYYPLWGTVDPQDRNALALVVAGMGCAYLGVQLAAADQAPGVWDTDRTGDNTPGSWGGHCLLLWDYTGLGDNDLVTLLTWGTQQKATWRWLHSRIMEAHGIIWPQMVLPSGFYPTGPDLERLRVDNAAFLMGNL